MEQSNHCLRIRVTLVGLMLLAIVAGGSVLFSSDGPRLSAELHQLARNWHGHSSDQAEQSRDLALGGVATNSRKLLSDQAQDRTERVLARRAARRIRSRLESQEMFSQYFQARGLAEEGVGGNVHAPRYLRVNAHGMRGD